MRLVKNRRLKALSSVYWGLIICIALIGAALIGGTVYGVFFHKSPPYGEPVAASLENGGGQTFTGIGRIRVSTADPQPGMAIVSVSFVYYPEDKAFSEELALRVRDFRDIVSSYIGSFSAAELGETSEENIKSELLRRFNAILRLGQIEALYFSDFMIIG